MTTRLFYLTSLSVVRHRPLVLLLLVVVVAVVLVFYHSAVLRKYFFPRRIKFGKKNGTDIGRPPQITPSGDVFSRLPLVVALSISVPFF